MHSCLYTIIYFSSLYMCIGAAAGAGPSREGILGCVGGVITGITHHDYKSYEVAGSAPRTICGGF